MNTCQAFLTASRTIAVKRKGWTDRACTVLDDGFGGYTVEDYNGTIVWQGDAHCRFCARAEAIAYMESSRVAAAVPLDHRPGSVATVIDGSDATSGPEATTLQGTCFDPTLPALLRRQAE